MPLQNFADADASEEEADYIIYGVPFDRTASFRAGAKEAPSEIRKASYNFETFMYEHGVDLCNVPVQDRGDLEEYGCTEDMVVGVEKASKYIADIGKFPIAIGGEHSISPPALAGLTKRYPKLGVLVVDAHLDYRDEYEGDKNNHACATRRFSDIVGIERVLPVGIRSMCKEEYDDAKENGLQWITASEAVRISPSDVVKQLAEDVDQIYLSIDIDGIDPAYAPGTGTPEPFGLTDTWVKELIQAAAPLLIGMDLVEVCPPADNGNTSALAARLIREAIAAHYAEGA